MADDSNETDNFNTIAGWALFSGIVALGLASLSGRFFEADKNKAPEVAGNVIAGVVKSGGGGAAAVPIETLLAKADPAKGEGVFKKCLSCHTITSGGANGIGPNLYGVLGDGVGTGRGGFAFSDDLKKVGGKWDFKNLDHWLANPKAMASTTKMTFAGLEDAQDRANVIAYINAQGSNLPLPKVAPETAPAGDAAAKPAEGAAAAPAAK